MAGIHNERQESSFISHIASSLEKNQKNPINLIAGKTIISNVIGAEKYTVRQENGSEPYTDIVLSILEDGNIKKLNLQLKSENAHSSAGGGLNGLENIIPGIANKFMISAYHELVNAMKLKHGDKVPNVYGQISKEDKIKIVVGNKKIGGPVDYMYIGSTNVEGQYDVLNNTLTLNGELIDSVEYANTHDLYFRLRARRSDQTFDPDAKHKNGIPKIYGKSPSKKDSSGRIVMSQTLPKKAILIKIQ